MKKTINYMLVGVIGLALLTFAGCSKKETVLPKIDGYNNSDEVAKTNLVAHWTFDSNNNEVISNSAPTNTYGTVGSTTGKLGNALKLTGGALKYPALAKLADANALNNFTVSLWVNVQGTKGGSGGFTAFFGLVPSDVTDIWGDVMALAETGRHLPTSDTLEIKSLLNTHPVGGGNSLQDNVAAGQNSAPWFMGGNKWSHMVLRWDGSTHQFTLYGNAVSVGSYTDRGTTGVEIMAVPVLPLFGSLPSSDVGFAGAGAQQGWNPLANASIDDVRVFNTALTDAEVAALFALGSAGR